MTEKSCWEPQCMAPALIRWALGLLFFVSGIGKIANLAGFVQGYLAPAFQATWLPAGLVSAYGYALPFVEVVIGGMLILGLFPRLALFVTGLTLLSLAFGQMLLKQQGTVGNIFLYILMAAAALNMQAGDVWTLPWRRLSGSRKES